MRRSLIGWALLAILAAAPAQSRTPRRAQGVTLVATGYCLGPCRTCGTRGITRLGSRRGRGVAVGRRRRALALGSRVTIPGYGTARVDDVGGGVAGNQVDLRFRSHAQAQRWGRRAVQVRVHRKK